MTRQFLLITLAAPMASFGELAGHERRGGRERPGKSALLGLLGAALGIRRDDGDGQMALANGYDVAVRVENSGTPLQDFHTTQTVPAKRGFIPRTRADALRRGQRETILTRRDYRTDVHYTTAFEALENARWSLKNIVDALRYPCFTLYLGRKSCPLSAPLHPRIYTALNILEALEHRAGLDSRQTKILHRTETGPGAAAYVAISEAAKNLDKATINKPSTRIERVNDQPLDRLRWHFSERREAIYPVSADDGDPK